MIHVDPYETLGLPPSADEAEIRRKYLELVRQFPPDRAPEKFAAVREAYDALRDPVVRVERQLFDTRHTDTIDAIRREVVVHIRSARITSKNLLALANDH